MFVDILDEMCIDWERYERTCDDFQRQTGQHRLDMPLPPAEFLLLDEY